MNLKDRMQTATTLPRPAANAPASASPPADTAPAIDSQDLLRGLNAVTIAHNGNVYRLQATRQGKLILTK